LAERFYWQEMKADVARYIRGCMVCLKTKPVQKAPSGQMGGHSTITRPWEVICTDLVGRLPQTKNGHRYVLIVADCFSKYVLLFPLRSQNATAITKILEE